MPYAERPRADDVAVTPLPDEAIQVSMPPDERVTLGSAAADRAPLRWIRAQTDQALRLNAVDDADYLRSDAKYTVVGWRDEDGGASEAVVRTPLKELLRSSIRSGSSRCTGRWSSTCTRSAM